MKKKIAITILATLIIFITTPFVVELVFSKKGNSYSLKIPMDSYCDEKQNSNSLVQKCTYSGGNLIFQETIKQKKVEFKRELTDNNCFEFDFVNRKIQAINSCTITAASLYDLDRKVWEAQYGNKCSPNGRYCAKHSTKGVEKTGKGIGLFSTPDRLYGLEIFEIKDITEDKTLYRKVKLKIGGSKELNMNTYWGKNNNFLLFENNNRLHYIKFE